MKKLGLFLLIFVGMITSLTAADWWSNSYTARQVAEWRAEDPYKYYNDRPWLLPPTDNYSYWPPSVRSNDSSYYVDELRKTLDELDRYRRPQSPAQISIEQHRLSSDFMYRDLPGAGGRPATGYLDMEWGTSVPLFLRLYPSAEEITDENDYAVGSRRFLQEHVGGGIESRQFVFFENQLFEVYVIYGYVDEWTTQLMHDKLMSLYGPSFKTTERESRSANAYFTMVDRYINYNRNLQVVYTIANAYNYYNYKLGTIMTCLYVNLAIKSDVERARISFRRNRLPM
ncbi:MAG: hypothetical protein LBS64_00025 [Spirochaetaceae bacterium]|jgi:hypothetical protein|nr:hypothetical protein [Spirochaetaceae bacterium]